MAEGDRPGDRGGDVHGHQVNIGAMHGNIGQIGDTYVLPGRDYRPPFQMPPRPVHFTGRTGVLATLKARLQPGQDVTLHGAGGIGKTALASGRRREEAATGYYETALALRRELGDRPGAGQVLFALARLYQGMGQTEEALAYGEQALVLLAESDPTGAETVRVALEGWRE